MVIPINQSLMTRNERIVYEKIKKCISEKYIIFPQISIRSIIQRNFKTNNNTQWKIVDFLVCEKDNYKPVLVIEVNDKTHEEYERKVRDENVYNILSEMNLPIWFLKPESDYTRFDNINLEEHIKMMIDKYLEYKKIGFEKRNSQIDELTEEKLYITEEKLDIKEEEIKSLSRQIKKLNEENEKAYNALKIKDNYYKKILKAKNVEIDTLKNKIDNLIIIGVVIFLVILFCVIKAM